MIAGKLNRVVTLEEWGYTKDELGNPIGTVVDSWVQRANVEDRTGSQFKEASQQQWSYTHKITVRISSKAVNTNNTLVYEGYRYTINEVSKSSEGHKDFYIIRATKTELWLGSS